MFTFITCNRNCIYQKEGICYKNSTVTAKNNNNDDICNFYFPKKASLADTKYNLK